MVVVVAVAVVPSYIYTTQLPHYYGRPME